MSDLSQMMKRQQVLADFGEFAIRSERLDEVLTQACRLAGEALGTHRAKILEIQEGRQELLVRAGVGWAPEVVGKLRLPMSERSSETYSINAAQPVISRDIAHENRFDVPEFMKQAGVVALVNVPIFVPGHRPYGVLQVDDTKPRDFGDDEIQFLRTYAMTLGPVIDRLHLVEERANAAEELRKGEERLRLIVESARDYAIFTLDVELNVETWPPGAEAVFGWTRAEIEGRCGDILFTPEDRALGAPQSEAETALRDGKAPDVRWHLHKDGRRVFIEGQSVPLFEGGKHTGFLKIGQDVTSRRAAQEALRESEERLRQFGEASQDVLWARDPETLQWTYLTPAFETIYGVPRDEALRGDNYRNWMEMILPEDREAAAASVEKVRQGERVMLEYRIRRPNDGEVRWLRDTTFPIFDEAGRVTRIGGIGQDITDDKEAAERMAVLVAELQHRTRNLMGVVRATAKRTGETSDDYENFSARFNDRLEALARVQGLLSRLGDTDRVSFDELIRTELRAMHGSFDRVTLDGPTGIRLRSSMVQTLAMALHELATNAVKYGALGQPNGHLSISWQMAEPDRRGRPRLHIDWHESGVLMPPVDATPQGGGQGRELIENALPYQLNAQTRFELGPDGVRCSITIPVSDSN
ncbi:Signal transduction histidine kinase [Agrobacterium tumefaciens str. Kerr 14]|uniref:Blue-light-activated histidine kinase n=1 Tax=Agrobacterium tumefaciens str. Kerr 14 TaxID=1183424 RepID=A0A1S7SEV5_AGRTU|nr:PAS domain S-box protein [Agrobacterium tumefaciens]CUX68062.1 Signal transduction histidine kinase [Agrobacterium tumefaciens str. Kerr 14]